ncbi:hypothetical protein [Mangrovihabitans endophyticus]|uniref:Uncharacterized protein n=1 Tax=Mangrovihabitans endophyticus TaxID=1751298 RepID=A0A8J3C4T1_9ACTN|nr:hypothetical protein [Mangrovihabitans endophyticus]GGL09766.1 hypothetical protein GCM10012284_50580 [Mangrovihabitans endophyticus]
MGKNTVKPGLTRNRRRRARRSRRAGAVLVWLVRFVTGRALDGRRHSDATFWSPGSRRLGPSAYLVTWRWWALAAGWQRAGIRLTLTTAVVYTVVGVIVR